MTRTFEAPRDLVWSAFTDPQHVGHWYGPDGFTITTHEMDVRPGGAWLFVMHGPDGTNYDNRKDYVEVVRPERLVFVHGSRTDDPDAFHVTVTFAEEGPLTRITMRLVFKTKAQRDHTVGFGAVELGYQTLAKLADYVEEIA